MELEDQEGFNNTTNYHLKPYKSSSTKKYHGERSSIFNLNVPLSEKNLTQFLNSFEKTKNIETQLDFTNALLKAPPDILEKFAGAGGLAILARILNESARELSSKFELVDKILSYLNRIPLTTDMLTKSSIHHAVENIKNSPEVSEELSNKSFKLLIKWREVIKEWVTEGGEYQAQEYEREKRIAKTFIKRTNRYERSSGDSKNSSRSSEERSTDSLKRHRESKNFIKPRHGNFPSHKGKRYERDHQNVRMKDEHEHDESEEEEFKEKKTVKWNDDPKLVQVKFFRFNDEPSHRGLTEEEVTQIQEKLVDDNKISMSQMTPEDIKHKESQMEGRSLKMRRDNEKEIQNKLNAMVETIPWYRPKKLDAGDAVLYGKDSREIKEHEKRISTKLPCFYLKEYQIPDQPSFDSVKNMKRPSTTPVTVPLTNSATEREPEENQDLFKVLETLVQKSGAEATNGATTTADKKPVPETTGNNVKIEVKKEEKKVVKSTQPRRGILKKTKEQIMKEKEEAMKIEEEKKKEKEKEKRGPSLDSSLVMKLVSGEMTKEEQEEIVHNLKETGDAQGLLQNIATLKQFMTNVSQSNKPKKKEKFAPNQNPSYGQEPRKMIKTEPQPHHHTNIPMHDEISPDDTGEYEDDERYQRNNPNQPGRMNMDRQKMKKMPFRPTNYKTVPCVWFHSPRGCPYGETCNFIHDWHHAGRQTPNMYKYVRPLEQINKTGEKNTQNPMPMQNSPNSGFSPPVNPNPSNFYGGDNRSMNVEKNPNINPNMNPNLNPNMNPNLNPNPNPNPNPVTNPYMNAPMNPNMNNPQNNYGRMNQPSGNMHHNNYMHSNPNNMNPMPYNRMGGGQHPVNPHMNHPNPHGHPNLGNQQGHPNHPNPHGGHPNHPMMMQSDPNAFRNDMMYQSHNTRMPPNQHMQMPMRYNPNMPSKGMMPPNGPGYGIMDLNKGKE